MPDTSSRAPFVFEGTIVRAIDRTGHRDPLAGLPTHHETGSIKKSVTRRALDHLLHPIAARFSAAADTVRRLAIERDLRIAGARYRSMQDVLRELGVPAKGIISGRASNRLRRWCVEHGRHSAVRIDPATGRYIYRGDAVRDWLESEGRAFVAQHQASIAGKAVMPSKRRRRAARATEQGGAS